MKTLKEYNDFTTKIFGEYMKENEKSNIVFSPTSIVTMLAMAAQATNGTTREEIVNAVMPGCSYDDFIAFVSDFNRKISKAKDIDVSTAVIIKEELGAGVKNGYAESLENLLDGELLIADDMVQCANDWISEKTDDAIPEILHESQQEIVSCLLNAVLCRTEWLESYDEDDIEENQSFMNIDGSESHVTMLSSKEPYYIENEKFTGFCKPCKNGFSYMALLPKKKSRSFMEKAIRQTDFSELFLSKSETDVLVEMPEFSGETNIDLNSACQQMGIRAVFTDEADFSGMSCERLKLDAIIHEAKIDLDRHGVRAAAATSGMIMVGALPDFDIKKVTLDRPFVYAIIHDETELPIFVGTVNQLPDRKKVHLDADLFIHPLDKAAMAALKAIPGFSQVMKAFLKVWNEKQFKIVNMSTNLKLSDKQMKKYCDMLPPICEKLGIDIPEIYVELDVSPNAYTSGDTKPFIVLTSGLFETLPDELIPSVIAHECGHIACHHVLYTTMGRVLLSGASSFITGLGNVALYPIQLAFSYWMRCSELSADRAAMIYEGYSDHVVETMMRFAGCDKDIMADASVEAFLDQAKEYREMVNDSAWNKTLEFIYLKDLTHPLNAVRALEAHEWEQTDRFKLIMAYMEDPENTQLPVKLKPHKYLRKNVDSVKEELSRLGFYDVQEQRSTETDGKVKPEEVMTFEIDGNANCEDDYYLQTAQIILTVYRPKTEEEIAQEHPSEIKMVENSKFYIGKHYNFAAGTLGEMGFTNIEVKEMAIPKLGILAKPDMVAKILINGEDQFRKDSWYSTEAKITIYYYVRV